MDKNPVIFLAAPASLKDDLRRFAGRYKAPEAEENPEEGASPSAGIPSEDDRSTDASSPEETLEDEFFKVNPSILLPVEFSAKPGKKSFDPETLSWETILSGMLRIIASGKKSNAVSSKAAAKIKPGDIIVDVENARIPHEWVDYYRAFVLTVKPEIYHEFSSACIVKAGNGEFGMALEISAVLEGLFPGSPGVLLNKALILEDKAAAGEKKGRFVEKENAEALEAWEAALAAEPVLPDTLFNAAFFFMRLRDFSRARDCFSRYVWLDEEADIPRDIPREKKEQAEKIIRDISSQGLDDPCYQEAYECISRGNDAGSLEKIREFIERHPTVWNGWFMLGWALRKLGRCEDGIEAFKKAIELGGDGADIQNEMAICLMETGDLKGARKELEHALRKEPENTKIISNLGVLAMKAGNKEQAAAFFRTVLELDPADPLAKHYLEA